MLGGGPIVRYKKNEDEIAGFRRATSGVPANGRRLRWGNRWPAQREPQSALGSAVQGAHGCCRRFLWAEVECFWGSGQHLVRWRFFRTGIAFGYRGLRNRRLPYARFGRIAKSIRTDR